MKTFLLREEKGGDGYLFSRNTGEAREVRPEELARTKERADVDFIPLTDYAPDRARAAPFCVWLELTRQCNLKCPYCGAPDQGGPEPLSAGQIARLFEDFAECGVFEVRLTGGEPTLHPEFCKIVRAAADKCLFVSVNSNGVWSDSQREQFVSLPVGLYILSLDGPKRVHNALRPPDSYDDVVKTISVLIRAEKRVRINTVLCRKNKDHLPEFVAQLESLGVEALTLVPLRPAGRATGQTFESMRLSRREYGEVLRQVRELRQRHKLEIAASYDVMSEGKIFNTPQHFTKRCVAGVEAACVGPGGDLRACILLDDQRDVVGNLLEKPLARLWADDELWGTWRDESRLSARCQECPFFGDQCGGHCEVITRDYLRRGSPLPIVDPYCQLSGMNAKC